MIKITDDPTLIVGNIQFKEFFFGGGEKHVQILSNVKDKELFIELNYRQDSDIIELCLLVDALKRAGVGNLHLQIPYFPAARQDRVCNNGEPLSVKVYANLINSLNFKTVTIFDPHSEVTPALINNVVVLDNHEFVDAVVYRVMGDLYKKNSYYTQEEFDKFVLVSPDAGSNKKINGLAKHLEYFDVIRCDKHRDVRDGKILETLVYADDLTEKHCLIVDDICAKGGTFCALAKELKKKGAEKVYLIVSHYEHTADFKNLKESGIDVIYTTNSKPELSSDPMLNVLNWNPEI